MDINALMAAAQSDPQAAAFLQQLLAGGTPMSQRLPEIKPFQGDAPELMPPPEESAMAAGTAQLPVFDPAKQTMDKLLGRWTPQTWQEAGAPSPFSYPGQEGAPAAPGGPPPPDPGMIGQMESSPMPPVPPVGQSALPQDPAAAGLGQGTMEDQDLVSLMQRLIGGG